MDLASKRKSVFAWLFALLIVSGVFGENRAWAFFDPAGTAPGQIEAVSPTATGENYDASAYDAPGYAVAPRTGGGGSKPFAMGIDDHLDDFARTHGADTWKGFDDVVEWQPQVLNKLSDPNQRVLFNLDDVDVWGGVNRAASGRGGATDWELLQIYQNRNLWDDTLEFWQGGARAANPFE